MLSLLNFIDAGFFITLGIICLTSGLIMLYCYRRLNLLENSIIEHGKILQSFIINYNNQMVNNKSFIHKDELMNDIKNESNSQDNEKIYVSDEEEEPNNNNDIKILNMENNENRINNDENNDSDNNLSDGDNDSDSYTNSDSDNDNDSDSDSEDDIDNNIKTINIINNENNNDNIDNIKELITDIETNDLSEILSCEVELNKIDTNSLNSKIIELNNENLDEIDKKISVGEKPNYKKMKVDDLRILVVTKNLTNNDNALKMKKDELIKLLQ